MQWFLPIIFDINTVVERGLRHESQCRVWMTLNAILFAIRVICTLRGVSAGRILAILCHLPSSSTIMMQSVLATRFAMNTDNRFLGMVYTTCETADPSAQWERYCLSTTNKCK